jgi:hypothetical protein
MIPTASQINLENRRKRRAKQRFSFFSNSQIFLKRLSMMWAFRKNTATHWVFQSTMPLTAKLRIKLCLFSEPIHFFTHLFTQNHPDEHEGMVLALNTPSIPYYPLDTWGEFLQNSFKTIAQEWQQATQKSIKHPNHDRLVHIGTWTLVPLYKGGVIHTSFSTHFPKTMATIKQMPHCADGLDGIGQVVFSQLEPHTKILAHSGSTNLRLRYHLPIEVDPKAYITVHNESRSWKKGECLIFDDGLLHEVAHNGSQKRVILLVDLWRPELSTCQINILCKLLSV